MSDENSGNIPNEILAGLQSHDDTAVFHALKKLADIPNQAVTDAITSELETLAVKHENPEIRVAARAVLESPGNSKTQFEVTPLRIDSNDPTENLKTILDGLNSNYFRTRLQAIAALQTINYSSAAIRAQLEKLAIYDPEASVRASALAALDLSTNRNIRRMLNKIDRANRNIVLQEITDWEKLDLLERQNADLLRRRYDFDFKSPSMPQAVAAPSPTDSIPKKESPAGLEFTAPPIQKVPEGPPPTLVQTLLSETSIKIALYLGAFFVVAAAVILGVLNEGIRLVILIVSTFIFGALSVAIHKRLPQPSFALFIVFSFLLPITAGTIEENLRLSDVSSALYWFFIFIFMAIIWAFGTWLYESRLFSITAFLSVLMALLRIGDTFDAPAEFHALMAGLAVMAGLGGTFLIRKWRDEKFALPLFISTQLVQAVILALSTSIFLIHLFDNSPSTLWHLASTLTWVLAFLFLVLSNGLFPFALFPWLAAATLLPIPWFFSAAFDLHVGTSALLFFFWTAGLAAASEISHQDEKIRAYSLPLLLASIVSMIVTIATGFIESSTHGLFVTLGGFILYGVLQVFRTRAWLWTFALLNLMIAYLTFFTLPDVENLDILLAYELLMLGILLLLPDLLLKNNFKDYDQWTLPPRTLGAVVTFIASSILIMERSEATYIGFSILAVFFTLYTIVKQKVLYGYIAAVYFPLVIFFLLDFLQVDAWLPALSGISVLYFIFGLLMRSRERWSLMLRDSALVLGTIISFCALLTLKETGGWYALVTGMIFAAEMYLRRESLFEIGLPGFFSIGAFLILRDLQVDKVSYHLLVYSLVWLLSDLLAHLTFTNPRELKWPVRAIAALLTMVNYGYLFFGDDSSIATTGFAIYTLVFLGISLLYRQPDLAYTFTFTLPLFVTFLFREFGILKWIHPVIMIAIIYYMIGHILRTYKRFEGWDLTLLISGLGLGIIVSAAAPILGGLDAAIPVAVAATLWAVEAFSRKSAWLAFPANSLYLLTYFIILFELNQNEVQFYSIGAALLGLFQHYLLVRAGSKTGAFVTGMVSQLVLLGTSYIQMASTQQLGYFVVLFLQFLVVLFYGGFIIRSRSLTFTPIIIITLAIITVLYSQFKGFGTVTLIGCTGIVMLIFGIIAVVMRERITKFGERLSSWEA